MSDKAKSIPHRRRRFIRWAKYSLASMLLIVLGILIYLNQIGLPDFAKTFLQAELKANGLDLTFERLRWRWEKGLVAENVTLQVARTDTQPTLVAEDLKIRLDRQALLKGSPKVSSVHLSNGTLALPLTQPDDTSPREFRLDGLQTSVSFPTPNQWLLENFQAQCLGIQLNLQAELTNAYAIKNWDFKPQQKDRPAAWPRILKQVLDIRDKITLDGTPEVTIRLFGDAAHPERSSSTISLNCEALDSIWGKMGNLSLQATAQEKVGPNGDEFASSWTIAISQLEQESATLQNLLLSANLVHDTKKGNIVSANWTLNSGKIRVQASQCETLQILGTTRSAPANDSRWATTMELLAGNATHEESTLERFRLSTSLNHQEWDWETASGDWTASANDLHTPWATVQQLTTDGRITPRAIRSTLSPESLGPWAALKDFNLAMGCQARNIDGETIKAEEFDIDLKWELPHLTLEKIQGQLYDGSLSFTGGLNVTTRQTDLEGEFDFDVHRIKHLLTHKGKRWINQYTFNEPPQVTVSASVTLPAWDDPAPDWRNEVKPTMALDGRFNVGKAAFRTVPVDAASSSISFTNMTWRLPDLLVHRPEGKLHLDYRCDARTQDYYWKLDTFVDFQALTPLLSPGQKKGLSYFQLKEPVKTQGEVWGRWYAPELTRLKTKIATTNFLFRGEPIDSLATEIAYVNGLVTAKNVLVERPEGRLTADLAKFNSHSGLITLTNALSTVNASDLARMIGPSIERSFKSYRFATPPTIYANGMIPIDGMHTADAQFQVEGGPFSFWKFNVPDIAATVDWKGREVAIRSVQAPFYDGTLEGEMVLALRSGKGAGFQMNATVNDATLNTLFRDVFSPTNKSQGTISGGLTIRSGVTDDWDSWQGSGNVRLREGLLWDTPLFGIFSPVLNTLSPGLGNSRAETGQATFTITDSIIRTTDLIIQEPTTRLQYQGNLDFAGNLDARVEAELLRDTPMLGRVVSMALWPVSKLFVYQVSGNLKDPVAKPVYVLPKFLLNPLDSLRLGDN